MSSTTPGKEEEGGFVSVIVNADLAAVLPVAVWRYHRRPWLWHMPQPVSLEFHTADNTQGSHSGAFLERPDIAHLSRLWGCLLSVLSILC